MTADLVVNGIVGLLLAATLGFCFVLNRRIAALRRVSAEMVTLISGFESSIEMARESVQALKQAAGDAGTGLQENLNAATALRDELAFLTRTSSGELDRLKEVLNIEDEPAEAPDSEITEPQDTMIPHRMTPDRMTPDRMTEDQSQMTERSEAEKELVQALRQVR